MKFNRQPGQQQQPEFTFKGHIELPHPLLSYSYDPDSEVGKRLGMLGDYLRDARNVGTKICGNLIEQEPADSDPRQSTVTLVVVVQLRWFLECLGGIEAQIRASQPDAAAVSMRALLESYLSCLYVCDRDSEDRAESFMFMDLVDSIRRLERRDASTPSGRELCLELVGDKFFEPETLFNDQHAVYEEIRRRTASMDAPAFARARARWNGLTSRQQKDCSWFRLFGGPQDVRGVAKSLRRLALYEVFYRYWSQSVHARAVLGDNIDVSEPGKVGIVQIGQPFSAQTATSMTLNLAIDLYRSLASRLDAKGNQHLRRWLSEVLPHKRSLGGGSIIARGE